MIKAFLMYLVNFFFYNKEGWYIGDVPTPEAQSFRVMTHQKPYTERTCVMCKRKYWSHKKSEVCFRIECYMNYHRRLNATNPCKY